MNYYIIQPPWGRKRAFPVDQELSIDEVGSFASRKAKSLPSPSSLDVFWQHSLSASPFPNLYPLFRVICSLQHSSAMIRFTRKINGGGAILHVASRGARGFLPLGTSAAELCEKPKPLNLTLTLNYNVSKSRVEV